MSRESLYLRSGVDYTLFNMPTFSNFLDYKFLLYFLYFLSTEAHDLERRVDCL